MELLKHGSKGQPVLTLQCALAEAGVFSGDLDGCFGAATGASIAAFQVAHKLPGTGLLDERTVALLGLKQSPPAQCTLSGIAPQSVARLFPEARLDDIEGNLPHVLNAMAGVALVSTEYLAMALATIRTEASLFLPISEKQSSLNTSPGGKPFDLYDHRAGLGNKGPNDGADFRGRGFIQLTGRANYLSAGEAIGMGTRLVTNPLLAHDPAIAAKLLANFLHARRSRLGGALQQGDLIAARKVVNGGTAGLQPFLIAYRDSLGFLPKNLPTLSGTLVA